MAETDDPKDPKKKRFSFTGVKESLKESLRNSISHLPALPKTEGKQKTKHDDKGVSDTVLPTMPDEHRKVSHQERAKSTSKSIDKKPPLYHGESVKHTLNLQDFKVLKLVGKGGFAKVYKVYQMSEKRECALKVMRKDHVRKMKQAANVINEKNLQQTVTSSDFIVKVLGSFQDSVHLFILQEFLDGGDLFSIIRENGHFHDAEAKFYAFEIFLGLSYLHHLDIVYRDLKPENILFGRDGHIKLADMGFAKKLNGGKTKSFCGTPSYLAPEVLERKEYGLEVDWWTFGVLIFQLCSGCSPFQESHPSKTFSRILNCAIRWPPEPQNYFNEVVFDLIMGLFEVDPVERLLEEEIRQHEWFQTLNMANMEKRAEKPPKIKFAADSSAEKNVTNMELSTGEPRNSTDNLFLNF